MVIASIRRRRLRCNLDHPLEIFINTPRHIYRRKIFIQIPPLRVHCRAALAMTFKSFEILIQIPPLRVHCFNERYLLRPATRFDLFFKGYCLGHCREMAVKHQLVTIVPCRKGIFMLFCLVLDCAVFDPGSHTCVEDFVVGVGCDVCAGFFHNGKVKEIFGLGG